MRSYADELTKARQVGASKATDAGAMALFCDGALQLVAGAVSPKLVWEGAQRKGMTALELAHLAARDPYATSELMWA